MGTLRSNNRKASLNHWCARLLAAITCVEREKGWLVCQ
jgi:hypothetical protein